jgi:hypothetical protein
MRNNKLGLACMAAVIAVISATSTAGFAQKGGGGTTIAPGTVYSEEFLGDGTGRKTTFAMKSDGSARTALFTQASSWPFGQESTSYGLHNGNRWFVQMADPGYEATQFAPELRFFSSTGQSLVLPVDFGTLDPASLGDVRWVPGDQEVSFVSRRIEGAVWDEFHSVLLTGTVVEAGIFAVQVQYNEAGEPAAISAPYLKVATPRVANAEWGETSAVNSYDWSPAGDAVVCAGDVSGIGGSQLAIIDSSGLRIVRSAGSNMYPAWASGTINRIAYAESVAGGGAQLCTIGISGSGRVTVYAPKQTAAKKQSTLFPKWSPDNASIIYLLRDPNDNGVFRITASGSGNTRIANGRPIAWK